jgi:aspartate carbamoyltransferase catalytic subunit
MARRRELAGREAAVWRGPSGISEQRHREEVALQHVIESQQFSLELLAEIFEETRTMEAVAAQGGSEALRGRVMASMFYEPSTRTRMSFESAMHRLGGRVITTENAREFSSAAKGESLEDSIRIVSGYADVIVLRHYESGAAERAAKVSSVPLINAGDGTGQHPTQALLDLYTIYKELGRLEDIHVAMVGDLANGRTARSLSYLLGKYRGVRLTFVAPDVVRMRDDIKDHLREHGVAFEEREDLRAVAPQVDVIYQTRIQKERFGDRQEDYRRAQGVYIVDRELMSLLPRHAIVMHPLPRAGEIDPAVDDDPRCAYFRQAINGLYVRMALLYRLLARRPSRAGVFFEPGLANLAGEGRSGDEASSSGLDGLAPPGSSPAPAGTRTG